MKLCLCPTHANTPQGYENLSHTISWHLWVIGWFQTGYLTIHQAQQPMFGHWIYTLGYPNREVESSLNSSLLAAYSGDARRAFENRWRLQELLMANNLPALRDLFHSFYASIPHDWYRNNPMARYEGYYASIFYSYSVPLRVVD
jgi:hypothetical protein